jgi:acetylornithine deacetylase/succinyl-diaminopimelate desuccinylase-like protein
LGLQAHVEPIADGRSNARVTADDRVDDPEPCDILMVGHLDTVPADLRDGRWTPFAGQISVGLRDRGDLLGPVGVVGHRFFRRWWQRVGCVG